MVPRFLPIVALLPLSALAQQMVSMETSGDNAIVTLRVQQRRFTSFSGAPYSAKRVTVHTEIRPDGTRVPQNRTELFYRDLAGRNRTEQQIILRDSPYMTTIMDPILGCEYVLDPGNKIAHRLAGVEIGTMPVPARIGQPDMIAQSAGKVSIEDLGSRTMQGLSVRGTKTITTWAPGTRGGNTQTLVAEREAWVADSMGGLLVASRGAEPGQPESSFTLEDVVIGQPREDLFAPPAGYRIVDETGDFKIVVPRKPGSTVTKLSSHGVTAPTIPNAPFSGTRRVSSVGTLPDGTLITRPVDTTYTAWRDSQGRVRTEWPPKGIVPGGVEIKDPTTGYLYTLDYLNHIAYRSRLVAGTTAATPAGSEAKAAGATVTVVQLGSQVVSGVPATGVRTTTERSGQKPSVAEIWTASHEGVMLMEKSTNTMGDDVTIELKNFSTAEPDPSLFRIPATYQILDEAGNQIQAKQ